RTRGRAVRRRRAERRADDQPRVPAERLRRGPGAVPRRHRAQAAAAAGSGPTDRTVMSADLRRAALADWLAAEGRIDVITAANRLGVAPETIRRDLRAMERSGRLQRVHGGAVAAAVDPILALGRPATVAESDRGWARAVWRQLPRSGTILLGAGEPTLALAELIISEAEDLTGLTVVTNSLDAALVLSRAPGLSVYNIGGTVSARTRAQEGDWALTELRRLHTDVSVICPAGISPEHGLTQPTPAAAAVSE